MKKIPYILIVFSLIVLLIIFYPDKDQESPPKQENTDSYHLQDEQFIRKYLLKDDGIIRTNFADTDEGNLYLSESSGLWLIYLALSNQTEEFTLAYENIKKQFQAKNKLFAWRIEGKEVAHTNALIDDLRIVRSLFLLAEQTNDEKWTKEAKEIGQEIVTYHANDYYLMDFYDWSHDEQGKELTISYIDLYTLDKMLATETLKESTYQQLMYMMDNLPKKNDWYPFQYDIESDSYSFPEEINLIDQLYIALHKEEVGLDTKNFYKHLKAIYEKENKLYGRYHQVTGNPVVDYESVAVYALAAFYAYQRDDVLFANELMEKMTRFQVDDDSDKYVSGYLDTQENITHSFDNLLALLLKEGMTDAQYLE